MTRPHEFTGMRWDTEEIRQGREEGWFRTHEADLIESARKRRADLESRQKSAEAEEDRRLHFRRCPHCGASMRPDAIETTTVERCGMCEGVFFDRGELERLLLRHDAHRRGFFRRLLGFEA